MKINLVISTAVLSLALGVAAPAFAQEQHEQEEQKAKPAQQEEKKAQPAAKQEAKPAAQQEKNTKPEEKNAQQQQRTQQAKPEQQAQHAAGGRIPDDHFKANFGREHSFHVSQGDYSNRHFQYGGYSFGFVDPWPSNWLYTQDVYVIETNGVYYLCNPMYPGVNITLSFAP